MTNTSTPQTDPEPRNYHGIIQPKGFPPLPPDWTSETETFASADSKLRLFGVLHHLREWKRPRVLIVLHGLHEHGGRYLHVPHFVRSVVDAVYCLDLRGHGRSEGLRGHVEKFDQYSDDFALVIRRVEEKVRKRFGQAEVFVWGHSMGGLITLRTLFLHMDLPIRAASVTGPLLGIKVKIPLFKKALASALSNVWGSLHMSTEVNPGVLSHDPEVLKAHLADRLVHHKVTPRMFIEMQAAIADTVSRTTMPYPLQMLIPLQDLVVDADASLAFFKNLKESDKQLKTYPNFYHEAHNEIGKEQVFEDLCKWISSHSSN